MYIAIVNNLSNRITKFSEFLLEADADAHVVTYGGFVFNNSSNLAIADIWVNGEVVTEVNSVSLADYKATAIAVNQAEAGRLIALLYGPVVDGFIHGSDKLNYRICNLQGEGTRLTLKVAQGINSLADDARILVLSSLQDAFIAITAAENTAETLINAADDKAAVDAVTVIWPYRRVALWQA